MSNFSSVVIGRLTSEYLEVEVLGYEQPDDEDLKDENWITCDIRIEAGGFGGRVRGASLQTSDFKNFMIGLADLKKKLIGEAFFDTLESWLTVAVKGDGLGHFEVTGTVTDSPGSQNRLQFALTIDQTDLTLIHDSLEDICGRYP